MSSDGSSDIFGMIMLMILITVLAAVALILWAAWHFAGWWGLITAMAITVFAIVAFILNRCRNERG